MRTKLIPIVFYPINLLICFLFSIELRFFQITTLHAFMFSLLILTDLSVCFIDKKLQKSSSHFFSINFIRAVLCILFLLPKILSFSEDQKIYIYNFFFIYFAYLFFEIYIRAKDKHKFIKI